MKISKEFEVDESLTRYWLDYYLDEKTGLCSLCGNTGVVDTRMVAKSPVGVHAGRLNWCICPNGRGLRKNRAILSEEIKR